MCLYPRQVVVESRLTLEKRVIDAPCGKCVECLKSRQNDWKVRICHECGYWSHVYFFTLTYRDSALPCNVCYEDVFDDVIYEGRKFECDEYSAKVGAKVYSTVRLSDVQLWLKAMREDLSRMLGHRLRLKYFICSEYGSNPNGTKRPHYHGILMTDVEYLDLLPYFRKWCDLYGRIDFKEVGVTRSDKSSVANYVSKYCAKGCFESRAEDILYRRISSPRSIMSKNIGLSWLEENKDNWLQYVPNCLLVSGVDWTQDKVHEVFLRDCLMGDILNKDIFPINYKINNILWQEIDHLLDNLKVYDGDSYSYKLPRYYYDRLFAKKYVFKKYVTTSFNVRPILDDIDRECWGLFFFKPCFAFYECSQPLTYNFVVRKDTRYIHSNFLSAAIAYRLRQRADYRDFLDRQAFQDEIYMVENGALCSTYEDYKADCLRAREMGLQAKLSGFFNSNMWKNRVLDFDADTYDSQLFVN